MITFLYIMVLVLVLFPLIFVIGILKDKIENNELDIFPFLLLIFTTSMVIAVIFYFPCYTKTKEVSEYKIIKNNKHVTVYNDTIMTRFDLTKFENSKVVISNDYDILGNFDFSGTKFDLEECD